MTGPGQTVGVAVFIDPMVAALDTSRAAVSSAYLAGTLAGATAMPVVGRFIDRRGIRVAQVVVGLAFTLALVGMSAVTSVVWLVLGFAGIRMFGQGSLSMVSNVSVAVWFERRRGLAMAILATAGGALMMLVPVALNAVIQTSSWRTGWLVAAAAVAVIIVPIGWFGLIEPPSEPPDPFLAESDGSGSGDTGDDSVAVVSDRFSYTRWEAARTRQFWILSVIGVGSGMLTTALNFHQIDLLGEAGLSPSRAAAMFLPQVVGSAVASLGIGLVLDRVGARFVPAFTMVILLAVHGVAASLAAGWTILAYALLLGAVGGSVRAALNTMVPGYFGVEHIGSIQGLMFLAMVAGTALGPVTLSLVEGRTGSYRSANVILAVIPVLGLLFSLTNTTAPPRPDSSRDTVPDPSSGDDTGHVPAGNPAVEGAS